MQSISTTELTGSLELTLSSPAAVRGDIEKLCAEARQIACFGVCVNGSRVELALSLLEETAVKVVALVGFPFGAADSDAKRYETEIAVDHGAHEIDFVINVGRLKDGDSKYVLREMRDVVEAADERPVKVILETHLLTHDERVLACRLAREAGVQFVCTSTDSHTPPVTVEEVKLMCELAGANLGIKASGGIRDARTAQAMLAAGAARIGMPAPADLGH